jgi:hypothetical protein
MQHVQEIAENFLWVDLGVWNALQFLLKFVLVHFRRVVPVIGQEFYRRSDLTFQDLVQGPWRRQTALDY